jgi:hypothetical protein
MTEPTEMDYAYSALVQEFTMALGHASSIPGLHDPEKHPAACDATREVAMTLLLTRHLDGVARAIYETTEARGF